MIRTSPCRRMLSALPAVAVLAGSVVSGATAASLPAAPHEGRPAAVLRHELAVTLFPGTGRLEAVDVLRVDPGDARVLVLRLVPSARVAAVSADGRSVPVDFTGGNLKVALPEKGADGRVLLSVEYDAVFNDPVPRDPVGTEDPGFGVTGHISPEGVFLSGDAEWYPDVPGSRASFLVRTTAPARFEVVTEGRRISRAVSGDRRVTLWKVDRPVDGLPLCAGPYVIHEGRADGIPVYTYFGASNDNLSGTYIEAVGRYLALYGKLLGPYPFEKFAVVENFFPTGYGFPSFTLLGSTVLRLPFIVETSLGHEIAHSWWGNGVLVDTSGGNWCEGLTTYVADYLYKERSSAREGREYRLKILRDYASLVPPEKDFPLRRFTGRFDPATRAVGYGKAAMIFHMSRRMFGEEIFWNALRMVVREKMGREASWDDFARAFEASGANVPEGFIRQWVDRPGAPVLALEDVAARWDGVGWTVTGRVTQVPPFFDLPVPLRIDLESGAIDTTVRTSGAETRFALSAPTRPVRLRLDPDVDVFRRLGPSEVPPTVNTLKGSTTLVAVASKDAPPGLIEAGKILLEALGHPEAPILREENLAPWDTAGKEVLFLGLPKAAGLLPPWPGTLRAAAGSFTLGGRTFDGPSDVLFAALPVSGAANRADGVFLAGSPEAAASAVRKIPHYGAFSYLVFSGGTNVVKGTWEPSSSPAVHAFPPPAAPKSP